MCVCNLFLELFVSYFGCILIEKLQLPLMLLARYLFSSYIYQVGIRQSSHIDAPDGGVVVIATRLRRRRHVRLHSLCVDF